MSFFLVVYDRVTQTVVSLQTFAESDRQGADEARKSEQTHALTDNLDREIVLFQAESEEALRHTHGSFFETAKDLERRAAAV